VIKDRKFGIFIFGLGLVFCTQSVFAGKASLHDEVTGQGYGTGGCGLGSIVFGDSKGPVQILSFTTNNWTSTQTFGISSGTSNCETGPSDKRTASVFITANLEVLKKDISRGNGETIQNLSSILGCSDATVLGAKLQQNFGTIFPDQSVGTEHVVDSIKSAIQEDSSLNGTCSEWT
jgi:hypothetical protein